MLLSSRGLSTGFLTGLAFTLGASYIAMTETCFAQTLERTGTQYRLHGEFEGEHFGWTMLNIGDVDGDDVADLLVGSPYWPIFTQAGRHQVFSGADGSKLYEYQADRVGAHYGQHSDNAGDVDGDQIDDYIISESYGNGNGKGRAYVFSGDADCQGDPGCTTTPLYTFESVNGGENFGAQVAGNGDFDGDGKMDFAVGAPYSGTIYVFSGLDSSLIASIQNVGQLGWGVAFLKDVNGDNRDEIVGSNYTTISVHSWDGAQSNVLYQCEKPAGSVGLGGYWIDGTRDYNNDGKNDIMASATPAGKAYMFSGVDGTVIRTFTGDGDGGRFGCLEPVDDINGDLIPDLVISARQSSQADTRAGKLFVYSGADGAVLSTMTWTVANDEFGSNVTPLGDIDDDGRLDIMVGINGPNEHEGELALLYADPECEKDLQLDVDDLEAGEPAEFRLSGGNYGAIGAVAYSGKTGSFEFCNGVSTWCVAFGLDIPKNKALNRIILKGQFDENGELRRTHMVRPDLQGKSFFFQGSEGGTYPNTCMSNIANRVVQ